MCPQTGQLHPWAVPFEADTTTLDNAGSAMLEGINWINGARTFPGWLWQQWSWYSIDEPKTLWQVGARHRFFGATHLQMPSHLSASVKPQPQSYSHLALGIYPPTTSYALRTLHIFSLLFGGFIVTKSEFAVSGFKKHKRGPRAIKGKCYLWGGTFKFGFCFFAHL